MDERKKRTYGYLETDPTPIPNKSVRLKKNQNSSIWRWIFVIILLPFRLIAIILRTAWAGVKNLSRRFSSLSKKTKKVFWQRVFQFSVILFLLGLIGIVGLFIWANDELPDPNNLSDRRVAESTKIYDRTGQTILYEIFADEKRTIIPLESIPKNVINGVIATEDKIFYEHHGIRPLSILRSFVFGVFTDSRIGSGASTLTQQLVKNAILTNDKTLARKLKEVILSLRLEQKFTKDQILQIYFNEIPYGSTNYGIESAAQSYFGKSSKDLTLAESATLAGLPKAPTTYLNNPNALLTRRNFVLRRMQEEGYITEEEKNQAQQETLNLQQRRNNIRAPHFVQYVQEQLV